MALNTAGIASGIAGLSVSGVTFKNITALPRTVTKGDCPVFFPDPGEWYAGTQSSVDTFGTDGMWTAERRFRYIYLHDVSTASKTISTLMAAMAAKTDAIHEAIVEMDVSGVDVTSVSVSRFGEIEAPPIAGQNRSVFFGCFFEIGIRERINA